MAVVTLAAGLTVGSLAVSSGVASAQAQPWKIVPSSNTSSAQPNEFRGVDCTSSFNCWAVGSFNNGSNDQTLIEHWDGSSWSIVVSPNVIGSSGNDLSTVACVTSFDCWAGGLAAVGGFDQTLVEHWDGSTWKIVSSPSTGPTQGNEISSIACLTAANCWAVGTFSIINEQTLIEHWDGSSWTIVASPDVNANQNRLDGVSCPSASNCWAVGKAFVGGNTQTMIQHWDGSSWKIVSSPDSSSSQNNELIGIDCLTTSNCWAVGDFENGIQAQTLVLSWDGHSWKVVPSPSTSSIQLNVLSAVSCLSVSKCWAVGDFNNGTTQQTLVEQWDGTSWSIVTSRNSSSSQDNRLFGVTCHRVDCQAVGHGDSASIN